MCRFKLIYFVIFILNLLIIKAQISDKRLCADLLCKEAVSSAKTLQRYISASDGVLSFGPNEDVTVFSKQAGSNLDLWGVEIKGKRGYVPHQLIREVKIFKKPTLLVDTEEINTSTIIGGEQKVPSKVEPNKVQEPLEVVEGTTIYHPEPITPSAPQEDIKPTSLPKTESIDQNFQALDVNSLSASKIESGETVSAETNVVDILINTVSSTLNSEENSQEQNENEVDVEDDDEEEEEENEEEKQETPNQTREENKLIKDKTIKVEENVINNISTNVEMPSQEPLEEINPITTEIKNESVVVKETIEVKNQDDFKIVSGEPPVKETVEVKKEESVKAQTNIPLAEVNSSSTEFLSGLTEKENVDIQNKEIPVKEQKDPDIKNGSVVAKETIEIKNQDDFKTVSEEPPVKESVEVKNEESVKAQTNIPQAEVNSSSAEFLPGVNEKRVDDNKSQVEEKVLNEENAPKEGAISEEAINKINEGSKFDLNNKTDEASVLQEEPTTVASLFEEIAEPILDEVTENPVNNQINNQIPISSLGLVARLEAKRKLFAAQQEQKLVTGNLELQPIKEKIDSNEEPVIENKEQESVLNVDVKTTEQLEVKHVEESVPNKEENLELVNNLNNEESQESSAETKDEKVEEVNESGPGWFSSIFSYFDSSADENQEIIYENKVTEPEVFVAPEVAHSKPLKENYHYDNNDQSSCTGNNEKQSIFEMEFLSFNTDILLYLATTAIAVIIFLIGYTAIDKSKREGPLIAKINKLEKELLLVLKEKDLLQNNVTNNDSQVISNELVDSLKEELVEALNAKAALEEQIQSLEKELENSTEVGIELNKMLSDILSSEKGSNAFEANIEQLQRQLIEQQSTINSINESLTQSEMENHELKLELEISHKKQTDLQNEVDKLLQNIWKIEEEKDTQQNHLENQITLYKNKYEEIYNKFKLKEEQFNKEITELNKNLQETSRDLNLKIKEFNLFKEATKLDEENVKLFVDVTNIRAELEVLKDDKQALLDRLQKIEEAKVISERNEKAAVEEMQQLRIKYDEADKLKVEAQTKLEVLSNYFKEKEAQLQKEINKHEDMWAEKQGEATSSTERIKFLQEQLQNIKSQNESLKQEIINQEVELKSQISMLEKKVHENWVSARQAERKLEDAKHEASQLRHRLTLRERAIQEDKGPRLLSPLEQNGDLTASPLHHPGSTASPPLLYSANNRDHITKSPPLPPPGMPFLPPPPPPGVPPFLPHPMHGGPPPMLPPLPPPNLFPGDHRPPPLGRMSSPPPRYSPTDSRAYSPYTSRHSSSPSESEYGASPPSSHRVYSPYDDRRDYKRVHPPPRTNGRKRPSSDSANSNESLEKPNRHHKI